MINEKKKMMDHNRQATHRREFWLKVHCYSHQALRRRWMCLNSQLSSQFPLPLFLFPFLHFFTLTKYFNVCAIMRTNCSVNQYNFHIMRIPCMIRGNGNLLLFFISFFPLNYLIYYFYFWLLGLSCGIWDLFIACGLSSSGTCGL